MELKGSDGNSIANAEKPKVKTISEILHSLRDKLIPRETPSALWNEWKQTIIENRQRGIPEESAPLVFSVGKTLLDTFQEMLPVKYPSAIDDKLFPDAAKLAKKKLEVARTLVLDESKTKLLVSVQNGGESKLHEEGRMVSRDRVKNEIGGLHTHPNNNMPSSTDAALLLHDDIITEFIITPWRVIALFRTDKTPTFSDSLVANGYLEEMGKSKGKRLDNSGIWVLTYKDLNELHILGYEASRGKEVFRRK